MLGCRINKAAYHIASGNEPTINEGSLTNSEILMTSANAPFKNPSGLHMIYVIAPVNNNTIEWKHLLLIMSMKWIFNSPDVKLSILIGS